MEKTLGIFVPIVLGICVTVCVYFISRFRYQAITKLGGAIPSLPPTPNKLKRTGIIVVGFALGILTAWLLFYTGIVGESRWNSLFIVGVATLFVGIAMFSAEKMYH